MARSEEGRAHSDVKAAPAWDGGRSGRPAPAFEDAARGSRGWGLRPADFAVVGATLVGALGVCCVLWFGFGLQGVPGVTVNPAADGAASEGRAVGQANQGGVAGEDAADAVFPVESGSEGGGDVQADVGQAAPQAGGVFSQVSTDAGSSATDAEGKEAAGPLYAVVQNSEGFYQALPMDEDVTVTVSGSLGTNVVEVSDGRVRCVEADCSNQTCVNQGWVSGAGQTIVCLPHKLTVQLVADPADASPLR